MVKHIVLFKLKEDLPEATKAEVMDTFKSGIEALPPVISLIRHIEVGLNVNEDEQWDICLNSEFDSLDDVRTYANHPAHKAVAGALKPFLAGRSCVDYSL